MDDLISRQAAIDAIKDRYYKYGRFAKIEELVWSIEQLPPTQPEQCEDAVSREEALNCLEWQYPDKTPRTKIMELPPVTPKQPEYHEIGYRECADAVLKMWMDNVLTDGEHNRIIDKLNAKWAIAEGDAE